MRAIIFYIIFVQTERRLNFQNAVLNQIGKKITHIFFSDRRSPRYNQNIVENVTIYRKFIEKNYRTKPVSFFVRINVKNDYIKYILAF